MYPSEQQFADYLTAQGKTCVYEPVLQLDTPLPKRAGNQTYKPDFYCMEDDIYYEVSANRQAYHLSMKKIRRLREIYPDIKIKVVNPDGSEYGSRDKQQECFRQEQWKPVVGYEGWYEVSDLGRIKRVRAGKGASKNHVLINSSCRGYSVVRLSRNRVLKNFRVARLVMIAFSGLPQEGQEVNHKNGIKDDDRPENLKWGNKIPCGE